MLALILAGGEGSRLRLGEKALVPVHDRPMISWVLDAFAGAECEPYVVTSHKTPFTRNWCRANNVEFIDTTGIGYVEDLREAVELSGEDGPIFTSAADIPCLTAEIILKVLDAYHASGKSACSTWIPLTLCNKYGMQPRYRELINGVPATPCALNIFMGSLVDEVQDELCLLLDEPGLAFNINTREELSVLEKEFSSIRGI
ncbi:MAG: NTP transferase domain-containing protein [Methanocorpusculum sp.]|jgi:adenosylcobinamide-phosphate guanylyltransferase|nr:NTP transferase domain-containing protein [Methanocorpusculum sp.]MDD4132277.1 NTP transferase domain-containing protein [Methanocorpusculum sp.]